VGKDKKALFSRAKRYYNMSKSLLTVLFLIIYQILSAQLTYKTLFVDYDSAWTYKNLKIIPIRSNGKDGSARPFPNIVTLSQALQQGLVTVSERGSASTENVHWLRINNKSNKPVYIGSGEVILGGRQDRMVSKDTLLVPTGSDQYISVMCVEEGRWSDKEKKFGYNSYAYPQLRKVLDQSRNQVLVWKEVANMLEFNNVHAPSLAYTAHKLDKKFKLQEDEYLRYFMDKFKNSDSTIVGFVCMSGERIMGCDVFAGTNLFYGALQPILTGYVEEAITYGKPVTVTNDKIKEYLDKILTDEASQAAYLKKNGKIYKYNDKVIHITGYGQ
jgi:hypothetical protein